jgi:hypothetical protein
VTHFINQEKPMRKLALAFAVTTIHLAGCGVIPPQVSYAPYAAEGDEAAKFGYPFRHRRSVILVRYDAKAQIFKAEASPYELDADGKYLPMYKLAGLVDWRATTQLKVSYLDNTKFPDTITTTTKDNVAETIQKVGSVVSALTPLIAGGVSEAKVAGVVVFNDTLIDPLEVKNSKWFVDDVNPKYCMRLRDVSVEQGIAIDRFISTRTSRSVDFPVPSCSTGLVEVAECPGGVATVKADSASSMRIVFADATTVTPMTLPATGSLKMNSVCGASITEADNQNRNDIATYLTTLITQVNNVKAAKKK